MEIHIRRHVSFFVTAVLLVMFYALSHTDKRDYILMDTPDEQFGWNYEILVNGQVQEYDPVFLDELSLLFPEGTEAVRISRALTEEISFAQLEFFSHFEGVEVFLEEELLYSNFRGNEYDANGFLLSAREELTRIHKERENDLVSRSVRLSLPDDYLGKTLYITTYFPEDLKQLYPAYPFLGNDESHYSVPYVQETPEIVILTFYALFVLITAVIFLIDIPNNRADWQILLLSLYFLLLFLNKAFDSGAAYYGILSKFIVKNYIPQNYLELLYPMPLFLYLALRFPRRQKVPLCFLTAVCFLYEFFISISNVRNGKSVMEDRNGLGLFLLFAAFAAAYGIKAFRQRKKLASYPHKKRWIIGISAIVIICILDMVRIPNNDALTNEITLIFLNTLLHSTLDGNFFPIVSVLADITASISVVIMGVEFIRKILHDNAERNVLQERSRLTLESYNRLLESNEAIRAVRHEMYHHMTALSGLLNDGDLERARRYITSVNSELEQLPAGQYSRNLLVNVIAGTYLNRARAEEIRVESILKYLRSFPSRTKT